MKSCDKVITGPLHTENKTATDWGCQGLIAYGCHRYIVVVEPVTLQTIQTFGPHEGNVTYLKWSGEDYHHAFATGSTYNLYLATADSTGAVTIWDVDTGQIRTDFTQTKNSKPVIELNWYNGHDDSHELLIVLRSSDTLELWDAFSGVKIWTKQFGEPLLNFAVDPFDIKRLIVLTEATCLYVLEDMNVIKEPSNNYRYLQIEELQSISAGSIRRQSSASERSLPRNASSLTKMANLATNILSGPESNKKKPSVSDDDLDLIYSCKQVVFNPAFKHIVLFVFATEIHMVDIDVELTIGMIRLDKSSPNFVKVLPCKDADMLYCLHDNGSVSVRVRKQTNNPDKVQSNEALDLTYDFVCQSDNLRLLRHSKVLTMELHPFNEKQVALILSDSRVIFLDVIALEYYKRTDDSLNICNTRPKLSMADMISNFTIVPSGGKIKCKKEQITLKMVMSGLVSGIISPITSLAKSAYFKNKIIAVGSGIGAIQLVNVNSGLIEAEFKLFTSPIRGLEWIDKNKILAYTYPDQPSYGNRAVKNDLVILNVLSGLVLPVFEGVNKKGPIQNVSVSGTRRLCVVEFRQGHMEMWDLKTRQISRELVYDGIKPFNSAWYPHVMEVVSKVNKKCCKDKERKTRKVKYLEHLFLLCQDSLVRVVVVDGLILDEHFGCIPRSSFFGEKAYIVKCGLSKDYQIFAGKGGELYQCEKRQNGTEKFAIRQGGTVLDIAFVGVESPRFFVRYTHVIDVFELQNGKPEILTVSPTFPSSIVDVSWSGEENIVIATEDACLYVFDLSNLEPPSKIQGKKAGHFDVSASASSMKIRNSKMIQRQLFAFFSPSLMDQKIAFLIKYSLQCNIGQGLDIVKKMLTLIDSDVLRYIQDSNTSTADRCYQVAKLFRDTFDIKFWSLVRYASHGAKADKTQLTDLTKPIDLVEWYSKLPVPVADTINLLDLDFSNDLDTMVTSSNQRSEDDLEISWIDGMAGEKAIGSCYGEMMKNEDYKVYETARLDLHNKKRFDYRMKQLCSSRYIRLCRVDMAVQVLMETDTDNSDFKSDYLKACLSSCTSQHTGTSMSTVKLAATHLIVAGYLSDGVDLLCLIGKHLDACRYLISSNKWQEAVSLAKTSLNERECLEIVYKWADHLWNNSQKTKAILLMLSHGQFAAVLQMLCWERPIDTAALFLQYCLEQGLLEKSECTESVFLEFAKLLTVTTHRPALEHYCHLAGDKGEKYLSELKLKMSSV